jgi:hypothetical protein
MCRKKQAKAASSRETGRIAPVQSALARHVQHNRLIYNDKERPRTGRENAGRFRFAQIGRQTTLKRKTMESDKR